MKRIGTISYNIYCNFTNYGSALQSWALHQAINFLGKERYEAVLVDYCPEVLMNLNPLKPFANMWDKDDESKRMCELSMPAIYENYKKFDAFYRNRFVRTCHKYTAENFEKIVENEKLDGFVCGSDTIFCPDEFGFDDGYYANYNCMKHGTTVAYAASFGDPHFDEESYEILKERLKNFKALGLRENLMIPYVTKHTNVPVQKVLDPTLLLKQSDYDNIASERLIQEKYILMYSRRYNPKMEEYVERIAKKNNWKIVDISLRATNVDKGHIMYYEAGVEEFLSLVKYAEYVVTNSFHGMIFSVQYERPFVVFSREQCDTKIFELLTLFGLTHRICTSSDVLQMEEINYRDVHNNIELARKESIDFLKMELELCL